VTRHASGGGRSRWRVEDRARPADMRVDTRFGDPQESGDLFRRKTAGDRAQHLKLTIGQRGDRSGVSPEDAAGNDIPGEDPDQH
jgi:hypothetical protein